MSQFVDNPDQWAMVRDDPSLIPSAVLEGVRIDSVAQWFTRVTTRDVEIDDILIPEGSRVLHSYAAANRDERHYPDPDRFDVRRNPRDTLAFGYGPHTCMGKALSNMEMTALWTELAKKVHSIEPNGTPRRHMNNLIRSLETLPVRVRVK
ncbi:cytochrome P450 [Rhodococcus sp. 3Y1]